ncbi:hypothetical protein M2401_005518 [Pseudomonas sp. JUb42]|uniref:DUF4214 domain-containing protein n=1 Tax=Pseudomonas sp. JUb42 TaxID=2940611 RepID=UPI00216A955A|nr:DUF4214 domain-containing protein [Pseudomonas sp. JUb42]MCS3471754.1 hypothetical protein [Pseudomonas sp. JUb42]
MSALTMDQAKAIAAEEYSKYISANDSYNLRDHWFLFYQMDSIATNLHFTPDQTLNYKMHNLLYFIEIDKPGTLPGFPVVIGSILNVDEWQETIPSSLVVNVLYPEGSPADKAAMIAALDSGQISKTNFTAAFLKIDPSTTSPTITDVIKAANTVGLPVSYPDSGLHVAGITSDQQDFVVAMYAAAFNRAPEFAGLKYWAAKLQTELGFGTDQTTAYAVISKQMYIDGTANKEGGTNLTSTAYVDYAYQNILGRGGDAAGVAYWNDKLATGAVDRGSFVAKFVGDALGNAGDGDFLQARIAVSKYAAQEQVSGPNAPGIDLHAVIQNVTSEATAKSAIAAIVQKYGTAATAHTVDQLFTLLAGWTDTHSDAAVTTVSSDAIATIELSGTSTLQGHDALGAAAA